MTKLIKAAECKHVLTTLRDVLLSYVWEGKGKGKALILEGIW